MAIFRKDNSLNDYIEDLDGAFIRAGNDVNLAYKYLDSDQMDFIIEETDKCADRRYFLENYYCIRTEQGQWRTLYPWWDHQEMVYEAVEEEFEEYGYCNLIVLKPRQTGLTVWTSAAMFHRTIFMDHSYTMAIAQNPKTSAMIHAMVVNAYKSLPWWLRPESQYETKGDAIEFQRKDEMERLVSPGLGSTFQTAHAQQMSGVAIGRTIRNLHCCLTENNLVLREDGSIDSIANARVGSYVMTDKGSAEVTAFSARHASSIYDGAENGYLITPWCNAAFPLEGTGNHKVLTVEMTPLHIAEKRRRKRGEGRKKIITNPKMTEFSEITMRHRVVVPVKEMQVGGKVPSGVTCGERKHGGGKQSEWHPPTNPSDIGFAVGIFLAEGSCNRRVSLHLNDDEQHLADRFAKAIGVDYGKVVRRPTSRSTTYHFYGSALGKWFSENVGTVDNKKIPGWLWGLGREAMAACVEGMILGDGYIDPKQTVTKFTTTRAQMAIAIRDAVCSLGHGYGSILSREAGFHYGRNCQKIYTVVWCKEVDKSLRKEYGWKFVRSASQKETAHWQYSEDRKHVYVNIRSVKRVPIDIVYDIEVNTEEHTYLLPGAITHNSEASRWPSPDVFHADILPSTRGAKDGFRVMESTGYGRNGLMYDWWQGSVDGDTGWRAVFIPVYKVKKYYIPIKAGKAFDLTEDEAKFTARIQREQNFEIPKEFWNFRRIGMKASKYGQGKSGFLESYPITPQEAYQASGICAFDRDKLEEQQMRNVCRPIFAGNVTLSADDTTPNVMLREVETDEVLAKRKGNNPAEKLFVWVQPEAGRIYELGVDSALGVKDGDFSACYIWKIGVGMEPDELVGSWLGHAPPGFYARAVAALGYWYNGAEIACEYQGPGISVGDKLKDLDYPALYRPQHHDRVGSTLGVHLHWLTTVKTRDQIIGTLNEALLEGSVIIYDEDLIDECIDFSSLNGGTRFEGQDNNDDACMAGMIGLYCGRESNKHVKTSPATEVARKTGNINSFGVYDEYMRLRGQHSTKEAAEQQANGNAGWMVRPVLVCNANTLYSPIFDGSGAEHELNTMHGMHSTHILPDVVNSYREAMTGAGAGRGGSIQNDDW